MSGYNRLEQIIGRYLDRFPRVKAGVEYGYQRVNYHLFSERGFEYELHEDVMLHAAEDVYAAPRPATARFVGFYDVCPWSPSMDSLFLHEVSSDPSDPSANLIVLDDDGIEPVATTRAWNHQQGSRTQWHPTRDGVLLFNDREADTLVGRVVETSGTVLDTYPRPLQAVDPTGGEYLSVNYRRLDRNSPGYGYGTDDGSSLESPDEDGIHRVGFDGSEELIVSFEDLITAAGVDVPHDRHYIHHALYSPNGQQFVFLHRWMDGETRYTRLYVADRAGETRLLSDNRHVSHFCWLDNERLFMWGGTAESGSGYYILNIPSGTTEYIEALDGYGDGHPSLSPDGQWIVTDTYPDRFRQRHLMLYHIETERVISVGRFNAPFGYDGVTRCDLHPRWSPDGRLVSIDSTHAGDRRSYVLDVSELI